MSETIITRSGSRYITDGVTVTRLSEQPIVGWDGVMAGIPLVDSTVPEVGAAWRYRTADGPFVTTTVVEVRYAD